VVAPEFLKFFLHEVDFLLVDGGVNWGVMYDERTALRQFSVESVLDLFLKLFESNFFLFQLHLHV
jgi:hypothetical protein